MTIESSLTTARQQNPRVHMKLMRNHFADGRQTPLCAALRPSSGDREATIARHTKALTAAMRASQQATAYRFGVVNAVFNPHKVLLGDDPECLKDDRRSRDWLDE